MEFLNRLNRNAFSELDINNYVPDIHGWMDGSFASVISNIFKDKDRNSNLIIIEVGSWKGLSCITIASTLKNMGFKNFKIITIDTWLGAPEFWTWGLDDSTRGKSLNLINGWPTVFYTFTKNIKYYKHDDVVVPLPLSSIQAVDILKHYNITADMIYIDAAHEYNAVKADISTYMNILKPGGSMIGDDYSSGWPGVKQAVDEIGNASISGVVWSFKK